jgi:hypothetical protein
MQRTDRNRINAQLESISNLMQTSQTAEAARRMAALIQSGATAYHRCDLYQLAIRIGIHTHPEFKL